MDTADAVLLGFALIGVFNAALLALAWTIAGLRRRALLFFWPFAVLALIASLIIALVASEHAGLFEGLRNLELALTALSGALLLDSVHRAVGREPFRAGYGVVAFALLLALLVIEPAGGSPLIVLLGLQWGFTALALFSYWRAPGAPPARRAAEVMLAFFVAVHVAQILRIAFPIALRDAVPLALSIGFAGLTTLLLVTSGGLERRFRQLVPPAGGPDLPATLAAWFGQSARYRDPELKLSEAASALGFDSQALSRGLAWHGTNFQGELTRFRLERAASLLRDPAEARTSVEAVGLLCGFASRSGFYSAFRKRFGESPAAFRRATLSDRSDRTDNPLK